MLEASSPALSGSEDKSSPILHRLNFFRRYGQKFDVFRHFFSLCLCDLKNLMTSQIVFTTWHKTNASTIIPAFDGGTL